MSFNPLLAMADQFPCADPIYYAFPTGSVYDFGMKRRRRRRKRTPVSSETASNIKILHIVHKAGLFHLFRVHSILFNTFLIPKNVKFHTKIFI